MSVDLRMYSGDDSYTRASMTMPMPPMEDSDVEEESPAVDRAEPSGPSCVVKTYGHIILKSQALGYYAQEGYNESVREESCFGKVLCRMLFLAQVIVSVATLPLRLLALFVFPLLMICTDGAENAWEIFKEGVTIEWIHYSMLPMSLLKIFAPQNGLSMYIKPN